MTAPLMSSVCLPEGTRAGRSEYWSPVRDIPRLAYLTPTTHIGVSTIEQFIHMHEIEGMSCEVIQFLQYYP